VNEPHYTNIEKSADYKVLTFISSGRYGDFVKIVRFDEVFVLDNTYNLALGTLLPNGEIDFHSVTDNGDRNKILATIVNIVLMFIEKYPGKHIYLAGSDDRRNYLYQRAIVHSYDDLIQIVNIYGDVSSGSDASDFEELDKTRRYSGFLIKAK